MSWRAKIGDVAPEVELPTADGGFWSLAAQSVPVVLIFHRHIY